ncbi:MAG: ATP-binding cassette domain-containing protein [candidate division Zixibacteria bacterium]|nr:ATP-binding cassette domain-containing protein [candidate division Zixibacteria bacterium]MDH3936290.1 ATP-binding cassette domain-containing protein [candidate division Zixibacteria bacterium]MDH4034978.1 ATP-binding cassette domain-containing protein [candidate division Zixibacteria bacterium]
MIELKQVHFSYGDKPVLNDVTFEIQDSESVVIMGPSGSGKSTVLRLILGLECPNQGEVLVDHKNICRLKQKALREVRKKIGMVFQDGALFDSLTVGENIGYYLIEHTRLPWEEIEERARTMLGFVGLDADDLIDKLPDQLSGGMRRRVAIGRALLSTDPKIMLYDEPTTGLDPYATRNVINLINKLHHERSISSIVVTHQIADAFAVSDRFVVISKGRVAFDGSLEQLRESTDQQVVEFLEPFRSSMEGVVKRKFVDGAV